MFRPLRHNGKRQDERRRMDPDAIDRKWCFIGSAAVVVDSASLVKDEKALVGVMDRKQQGSKTLATRRVGGRPYPAVVSRVAGAADRLGDAGCRGAPPDHAPGVGLAHRLGR
jgi:hypothetical protein